ncbi:MAG: 4-hydroxy-tetrahydrodipicolinate reductase [Flavobacteriaceae bacterium]
MKIALLGYGKMGKTIERLVMEKGHEVVFIATQNTSQGDLKQADVAIEFSVAEAAVENISICFQNNIPVVSGTTGWIERYHEVLKICEIRNGSFIYASNFSVGVNLFFNLNGYLAQLMQPWKDYIPSIEEVHHIQKKDAPSGTAISLADGILRHSALKGWTLNSEDSDAVTIRAIREGDVKGTHIVQYHSAIDTLSIKHEAHSREGFALGAILAAEWLIGKKGVYTMKDVLNLK